MGKFSGKHASYEAVKYFSLAGSLLRLSFLILTMRISRTVVALNASLTLRTIFMERSIQAIMGHDDAKDVRYR